MSDTYSVIKLLFPLHVYEYKQYKCNFLPCDKNNVCKLLASDSQGKAVVLESVYTCLREPAGHL
jgi:hypothetical protein